MAVRFNRLKWRNILGPYRKCAGAVHPRKPRVCPAGAFAIGGFGRSCWRLPRAEKLPAENGLEREARVYFASIN